MCRNCGSVTYKTPEQLNRCAETFCDQKCANEYKKVAYSSKQWKESHWSKYKNDPIVAQMKSDRKEFIDRAIARGWACCPICEKAFKGRSCCCSEKCKRKMVAIRNRIKRGYKATYSKCLHCGHRFSNHHREGKRPKRKYCSVHCGTKAQRGGRAELSHIQRAKKHGCDWEYGITLSSLAKDHGMQCYICGCNCVKPRGLNFGNEATIEHVIPIVKGGGHTKENCRIACRDCNNLKGTRLMDGKQFMLEMN